MTMDTAHLSPRFFFGTLQNLTLAESGPAVQISILQIPDIWQFKLLLVDI